VATVILPCGAHNAKAVAVRDYLWPREKAFLAPDPCACKREGGKKAGRLVHLQHRARARIQYVKHMRGLLLKAAAQQQGGAVCAQTRIERADEGLVTVGAQLRRQGQVYCTASGERKNLGLVVFTCTRAKGEHIGGAARAGEGD
jgi:hypothetical protein